MWIYLEGETSFGKSWVWAESPTARPFCGREGVGSFEVPLAAPRGEGQASLGMEQVRLGRTETSRGNF